MESTPQTIASKPQLAPVQPRNAFLLYTPPNAPKYDFLLGPERTALKPQTISSHGDAQHTSWIARMSKHSPLSPPISPHVAVKPMKKQDGSDDGERDPLLFPYKTFELRGAQEDEGKEEQDDEETPLFASASSESMQIVDEHIEQRQKHTPAAQQPTRSEYMLVTDIWFRSNTIARYNKDPEAYFKREYDMLSEYPPRFPQAAPEAVAGVKRGAGKTDSPPIKRRKTTMAKTTKIINKLPRSRRATKASPLVKGDMSFDLEYSPAPLDGSPTRPTKPLSRNDDDFEALPDYCPKIMPNDGKAFKVVWQGQPLDLRNDPNKGLLHEAEIKAAGQLKLTCAQYLCVKRRLFAARLEYLRHGKKFNKTGAQQACRVDVNKASQVWTACDKVHWLDAEWMEKFL